MNKPLRYALAGLVALSFLAGCSDTSNLDTAATHTTQITTRTVPGDTARVEIQRPGEAEANVTTSYAQTWEEPGPAITNKLEPSVVTNSELAAHASDSAARVTAPEPATGFALDATKGGLLEVELGRFVASRSTDPTVQRLGQMMAEDHAAANAELRKLVQEKGLTVPTEDPSIDEKKDKLAEFSGRSFDKAYADMMVEDHEKDIDLFEREARTGLDGTLRTFAQKKLPVLRHHLEMARQIQTELDR